MNGHLMSPKLVKPLKLSILNCFLLQNSGWYRHFHTSTGLHAGIYDKRAALTRPNWVLACGWWSQRLWNNRFAYFCNNSFQWNELTLSLFSLWKGSSYTFKVTIALDYTRCTCSTLPILSFCLGKLQRDLLRILHERNYISIKVPAQMISGKKSTLLKLRSDSVENLQI